MCFTPGIDAADPLTHTGLVLTIARSFGPGCLMPFDDLVQEGMLALWRAATKYDPARGRPAPFFGRKIRWAMLEAIAREQRQTARLVYSGFHAPDYGQSKPRGCLESVPDHRAPEHVTFELDEWLDVLTARERLVVSLWFGIGRPALSPKQIGERLGVTRQRVWQIYAEAMDKIREHAGDGSE